MYYLYSEKYDCYYGEFNQAQVEENPKGSGKYVVKLVPSSGKNNYAINADGSNYYSQEYSVTSNVNVSNYTVTSISNFPEGSYIADLSGNAKTTFSGNEHFKVVVPKDKILDNFDGKISLNGKVKSYPVFFGQSPNPNWQNYALTYDAYYTAGGETTLSVDAFKSKIKVIKIDNETKK